MVRSLFKRKNKPMPSFLKYTLTWLVGTGMGFAAGVYTLPIIVASENAKQMAEQTIIPKTEMVMVDKTLPQKIVNQTYTGTFNPDAMDSDFLHRGWGDVTVVDGYVTFHANVKLTPGPDYRLYAIKKYTESESEFWYTKSDAVQISEIKQFNGQQKFKLPTGLDVSEYDALLIWCEAFKQFITVAKLNEK